MQSYDRHPTTYEIDGKTFESVWLIPKTQEKKAIGPAYLVVPDWMGINENAIEYAIKATACQHPILLVDMFTKSIRPKNEDEAGAAIEYLRNNRAVLRQRILGAWQHLKSEANQYAIDTKRVGGYGFCFGGETMIEFVREGSQELAAVATFHSNLATTLPMTHKPKCPMLLFHGALDPIAPYTEVEDFKKEMSAVGADWQVHLFSDTYHSFTNPKANTPGKLMYSPSSCKRAYEGAQRFFQDTFQSVFN